MNKSSITQLLVLVFCWGSIANGQESLFFPDDVATHNAVVSASNWLIKHVRHGKLNRERRECSVSVIAWKDPPGAAGHSGKIRSRTRRY